MKALATYKREYEKAKTHKGRQSAFNRAMNNLSYHDRNSFMDWQISIMNKN